MRAQAMVCVAAAVVLLSLQTAAAGSLLHAAPTPFLPSVPSVPFAPQGKQPSDGMGMCAITQTCHSGVLDSDCHPVAKSQPAFPLVRWLASPSHQAPVNTPRAERVDHAQSARLSHASLHRGVPASSLVARACGVMGTGHTGVVRGAGAGAARSVFTAIATPARHCAPPPADLTCAPAMR